MKVLSDKTFNDSICWTPSGKSFLIIDPKEFVAKILPEHFKSAKYSSFTRKLHRWGFQRHYRGEESGAFYHEDFQKDRPDLVEKMTCKAEQAHQNRSVASIAKSSLPKRSVDPMPESTLPLAQATAVPDLPIQGPLHPTPSALVASHFMDAAIEAEVSRRIEERIQQATLNRMFLEQQLNTPVIPLALRIQLMELQQKKLNAFAGPRIPLNDGNINPNTSTLRGLPQTNIQGAKTA